MNPAAILSSLQASGFTFRVNEGKLLVSPSALLTAEQRAAIQRDKAELVRVVREMTGDEVHRLWSMATHALDRGERSRDVAKLRQVHELLMSLFPEPDYRSTPCSKCRAIDWWRSRVGLVCCARCYPPDRSWVVEWIGADEGPAIEWDGGTK